MQGALKDKGTLLYILTCSFALLVVVLRAFFIPFSHDEAATFFFYVQNGDYLPYKAFLYTNNHVLNSALSHISYEIAGSHRFILRLPNILSFIILCVAVYRLFSFFKSGAAKILLTAFLLLNIHFLDFFELCRGYGISMACMTLGLSFLLDYFKDKKIKSLILFSLFIQLALAANLTLIVPFAVILGAVVIFQLKEKTFLNLVSLLLLAFNFLLLFFWLKFTLHYKEHGLLDSGASVDYWRTTFVSLMLLVFGTEYLWIRIVCILAFLFCLASALLYLRKHRNNFFSQLFSGNVFFSGITSVIIISFFILNKVAGVNFPEDRTVLFIYVFIVLALCFGIDELKYPVNFVVPPLAGVFVIINFLLFFNLQTFCHYFYHVTPKSFYTYLEKEFLSRQQIFTVGGHPAREMVYSFANYRGSSLLNPMDEPRQMHMNCDYYVALKFEEPYYKHFYEEVLTDKYWNRALLKRKYPIKRTSVYSAEEKKYSGNDEFFEFLRINDSALATRNCIDADVELRFDSVPKPFKAWIVFQANDNNDNPIFYKRVQLNWLADNLNGLTKRFRLTSPSLPEHFKSMIIYIWNIDRKPMKITLKELNLFKLEAKGINFVIPEEYYKMSKQLTDKVLL